MGRYGDYYSLPSEPAKKVLVKTAMKMTVKSAVEVEVESTCEGKSGRCS